MVWAFILGVYIGRGHQPEEVVPEISRIMPETRVRSNRTGSSPGTIKQDILKPEQLEFYDKLKNPPGTELHHDTPKQTKVKQIRTKATKHTSPSRKKKKKTKAIVTLPKKKMPKLVIIIDDVTTLSQIKKIYNIPYPVTMSFLPPIPRHKNSAKIAQQIDKYMIHLPLEAGSKRYEEKNTLHITDSLSVIDKRIKYLTKIYPHSRQVRYT